MKRPSLLSCSSISQPLSRNYLHVSHSHHATIKEITDRITKSVDDLFENEPRLPSEEKENNIPKWVEQHQSSCLKRNNHATPTRVKHESSPLSHQIHKGPVNEEVVVVVSEEVSESDSEISADDFLTFTKEDIQDFDEEDWDILMSKNTVQSLLDSLKTNQRTEVMSDLNMWVSSKSSNVEADIQALNQIEKETQKKEQELNDSQAIVESQLDNKELLLFQVLGKFYKILHELAHPSKGSNEETKDPKVNQRLLSSQINIKQLQNTKIEPTSNDEKPIWENLVAPNPTYVRQHPTAFLKSLSAHQDRVVNLSSKVEANGKTIQQLQSALKYLQNPSADIDPPDSDTLKLIESIKSKHVQEKAEATKDVEQTKKEQIKDKQLLTDRQQSTTEEKELPLQTENSQNCAPSVSVEKLPQQKNQAVNPKLKKQMKNYEKVIWTAENTLMIVNEQKKHFLESVERAKQAVAQKDSSLSDAAQNEERRVLPNKEEFEKAQQEEQTELIANLATDAMRNNNEKEANATSNEQSVSQGTNTASPEEIVELEQLKIENAALLLKIKQLKDQLMKGQEETEGGNKEKLIKKKKPKQEKRKYAKEGKQEIRQEMGKKTKKEEIKQERGKKTKQEEIRQEEGEKTKQEEIRKEEKTTVEDTTVQRSVADINQPSLIDGSSKIPPLTDLSSANIPPYAKRLLRLKRQNVKLKQQIEFIDAKIRALNVRSNDIQLDQNSTTTTEQSLAEKYKVRKNIKRKEKELVELRRMWWTEKQEVKGQNMKQISIHKYRQSLGLL